MFSTPCTLDFRKLFDSMISGQNIEALILHPLIRAVSPMSKKSGLKRDPKKWSPFLWGRLFK